MECVHQQGEEILNRGAGGGEGRWAGTGGDSTLHTTLPAAADWYRPLYTLYTMYTPQYKFKKECQYIL